MINGSWFSRCVHHVACSFHHECQRQCRKRATSTRTERARNNARVWHHGSKQRTREKHQWKMFTQSIAARTQGASGRGLLGASAGGRGVTIFLHTLVWRGRPRRRRKVPSKSVELHQSEITTTKNPNERWCEGERCLLRALCAPRRTAHPNTCHCGACASRARRRDRTSPQMRTTVLQTVGHMHGQNEASQVNESRSNTVFDRPGCQSRWCQHSLSTVNVVNDAHDPGCSIPCCINTTSPQRVVSNSPWSDTLRPKSADRGATDVPDELAPLSRGPCGAAAQR